MRETWLRFKWRDNGIALEVDRFSRDGAIKVLLDPVKRRGQGRFKIYREDLGVKLRLKQAVAAAGGANALAFRLGVERTNLYQWLKRDSIPKRYYDTIRELSVEYQAMEQSEGEWEGEDEGS